MCQIWFHSIRWPKVPPCPPAIVVWVSWMWREGEIFLYIAIQWLSRYIDGCEYWPVAFKKELLCVLHENGISMSLNFVTYKCILISYFYKFNIISFLKYTNLDDLVLKWMSYKMIKFLNISFIGIALFTSETPPQLNVWVHYRASSQPPSAILPISQVSTACLLLKTVVSKAINTIL